MGALSTLDVKLARDLRRLWAQVLAIALVLAAGVMQLVIFVGVGASLEETRAAWYERNRFAHVFASATRAPEELAAAIAALPGVAAVETRVTGRAVLDIEGLREPAAGRLISLPAGGVAPGLNVPLLREGRMPRPDRPDEVLASERFARAGGFSPGDSFDAVVNGQRRSLTIVGTAISPEFIYAVPPGGLMPDDRRFGIFWLPREGLETAFGMAGAFNDVSVTLSRGAREAEVIAGIDRLLAPYGGTGAVGRDLQMSHAFLDAELEQLRTMVRVLPPVFFLVAAFLVNMVLSRLIALEREQIGLLKALGYGPGAIGWHYVKLALLIGAVGVALGWAAGLWGARGMAALYQHYFDFPFLLFVQQVQVYGLAAALGLGTAALGAVLAVRRVLALAPAVAMSPPAPARFHRSVLDRLFALMGLRQTVLMVLRNLLRWPVRAGMTTLGLAAACSVMVATLSLFDAIDEVMETAFFQANRQDATLTLSLPRPLSVEEEVSRLPGVMVAEGALSVPARLVAGPVRRLVAIEGAREGADLARLLDAESAQLRLPEEGVVLSRRLAEAMSLRPGDRVGVEILTGARQVLDLPVTGLVTQYFGMGAYMDFDALNAALGQAPQVSAVHVRLDPAALDALYEEVKRLPGLAEVTLWQQVRQSFDETLAESAGISITISSLLGALIVVGVAYNAARIQLSERARELAGLRILGFTRGEVSVVLMAEMAVLTLLAIPLGFAMGTGVAHWLAASMSSDMYTFPVAIGRGTLLQSGLTVAVAAAGSALVVRRRIDRFDLVAVMKTRE